MSETNTHKICIHKPTLPTDNKIKKENKETITKNWPSDAFKTEIKIIEITKKYHAVIYNVDIDLDVNETSLMNALKNKYNITNATRIIKKGLMNHYKQ